MTHPKLLIVGPVTLLAITLALTPVPSEARSVLGRLWDRWSADSVRYSSEQAAQGSSSAATRWPRHQRAANGKTIVFLNSQQKGRLGDRLTALRLTGQGYEKLKSKYNALHGIDGVYVKRSANGEVLEIRLIDSKVDSAQLNPGPPAQMSDAWIRQSCQKMLDSGDPQTARTARLILDHFESPKLRREVWHHDLSTGKTTVRPVDTRGRPRHATEHWDDRLVVNELDRQCELDRLACHSP